MKQFGKLSGLNILLSISNETMGNWFMILTTAGKYISYASKMYLLDTYRENFFQMTVSQFESALQYETLPQASRRCYLSSDGASKPGHQSKCLLSCLMKTYHDFCDCHPFTIPILDKSIPMRRNCTALDIPCVWNNIGNWFKMLWIL